MLRAVAAGLCFELAHTLEPVLATGHVDRVALCGGAAGGWQFRELLAALFAPRCVDWLVDDQTAAARGAVQSLRPAASRPRTRAVRMPSAARRRAIRGRYRQYVAFCCALAAALGKRRGDYLDAYAERGRR
jgi:sugar (pentulose or hexulose) kinase